MGTNADVQFSVGEQSEAIRKQFWSTNYKQCPICKSENIAVHWWCCGCRFNEDEWDKTTRNLPGQYGCGFYTSFHYDEGGSEPQQFETDG